MDFKIFRCNVCGNISALLRNERSRMSCCGQDMELLSANTVDAATEKHVPFVSVSDVLTTVKIGEVEHPMLEEHYIEWVAQVTEKEFNIKFLNPGEKPEVVFAKVENAEYYEYCNLHGLWKK